VLQADEDVDIVAGRNINLKSGSGRVLISGNTLEKTGLKVNILDPTQEWAYRVYEGTGLPAGSFADLLSSFSGIANLAGDLVKNPNLFAGFVEGAVSNAIASATSFV
jgi:hypothetical protein